MLCLYPRPPGAGRPGLVSEIDSRTISKPIPRTRESHAPGGCFCALCRQFSEPGVSYVSQRWGWLLMFRVHSVVYHLKKTFRGNFLWALVGQHRCLDSLMYIPPSLFNRFSWPLDRVHCPWCLIRLVAVYNEGSLLRRRIIRAFLVEEQKIVRKVLKAQQASAKK